MSEMVDRVAAAIRESEAYWWNRDDEPDDGLAETLARAAIEAMREPTLAVLEAGPSEPYMDIDVWRAMIDEALK
jgi:hypothetical protein